MKVIIKTLTVSLLILTLGSCGNKDAEKVIPPTYTTMKLDTTTTTVYMQYPATIQSESVIEIRPRVSGYLDKIAVNEGQFVKKGDLLFKIDDADFKQNVAAAKSSVMSAKAQVSNATLEVTKLTPLVEKGIISPYELESAKINLNAAKAAQGQAEAQYNNAVIDLGFTAIKAPIDGVLGRIYVREGSLISSSSQNALTQVSSTGNIYAYFSFDEKGINKFRANINATPGSVPVDLVLADGSTYKYKGRTENASGIIDSQTGSIQIKVLFPNPDLEILTGSSGVLRFPQTLKGSIVVPKNSTYELQDRVMVYVVDDKNIVSRKTVTIVGEFDKYYVVTGIERGTTIVTEGVDRLKEGAEITPKTK